MKLYFDKTYKGNNCPTHIKDVNIDKMYDDICTIRCPQKVATNLLLQQVS